ncbi:hypothetical protein AAKU67_000578 [Oxalobacteraceae bacterium GrIS 2.11]
MLFSKQKTRYQSEITLFLEDLKKADPQLEQKQLAGRALLWDKAPVSLDTQRRILDSTVTSDSH